MDLSGVLATANPSSPANGADKKKFGQDFSQFLRLLTTQLQNQDPLEPLDSAQFTNQLVQFSGVEQQIKSNDFLQKLLTLNAASLTNVGLGYVGLSVQTPGSSFQFDGAHGVPLSYVMPAGAAVGTVSILDKDGKVVDTMSAELGAGAHELAWNGADKAGKIMPPGTYTLKVGAQDAQKKPLNVTTFTSGLVTGVQTNEDGSVSVIINGKPISVTDVRRASLPSTLVTPREEDPKDKS